MNTPLVAAILHQALLVGIAAAVLFIAALAITLVVGSALKAGGDHDDAHRRPRS